MSPQDFPGVDIDLLADYVGGALEGDDEAAVARLIAEDTAWRAAWEIIASGTASVRASLQSLEAEPMPADVVARLDAALGSPIADVIPIKKALVTPTEPHLEPVRGGDRQPASMPSFAGSTSTPGRRRRRLRWAAPIAAAAGVLAFAGIGIDYLANGPETNADSASSAAGSAENAAPMTASDSARLVTVPGDDQILASGTDYREGTLADSVARSAADDPAGSTEAGKDASFGADAAVTGLQRLRARDALLACLDAVAREKNAGPITVSTVDYARFQGRPALVVRFSAAGVSWVWATGPECGTPAAGASRLVEVRVG